MVALDDAAADETEEEAGGGDVVAGGGGGRGRAVEGGEVDAFVFLGWVGG